MFVKLKSLMFENIGQHLRLLSLLKMILKKKGLFEKINIPQEKGLGNDIKAFFILFGLDHS